MSAIIGLIILGAGYGQSLTIGLMPAVDSLPLLIAQKEGYFAEEGPGCPRRGRSGRPAALW